LKERRGRGGPWGRKEGWIGFLSNHLRKRERGVTGGGGGAESGGGGDLMRHFWSCCRKEGIERQGYLAVSAFWTET